jgi:hypothetical protein
MGGSKRVTAGSDPIQLILGVDQPHNNQYLFSDHYLENLLSKDPRWEAALPEAESFLAWLQDLYMAEGDQLAGYNESQLEDHWFRPVLEKLGHVCEGQASIPGLQRGIKRPDYVFFQNELARQAAVKAQGTKEYADKALGAGEVKSWDVSLGKKLMGGGPSFADQNPSYQIDYYLKATGLAWGILSNGRKWRLVHKDSSQRLTIYYEVDLVDLLQRGRAEQMLYFTLFFRQAAFLPDAEGCMFLDDSLAASHAYAVAVEEDLQENVYQALEWLMRGFLDLPQNNLGAGDLRAVYDNSLYLLYRLLFIFYAESRELLPLDNEDYREHYSLHDLKREIARENVPTKVMTDINWMHLRTLFRIINGDNIDLNRSLGVPRFNGGLFNPTLHPFLEEKAVGDRALVAAVDLLARRKTEGGHEFVDYRALGVRQLGSIYEGLLEFQPRLAEEAMVAVRDGKGERWLPANDASSKARVIARREAGDVYLVTDKGERKATGSYYTPDYIVQYIVENTLGPLVEEATERVKERARQGRTKGDKEAAAKSLVDEILDLKVLDPAMGSGHFLVAATDYLAVALATDPYVETGATPEEDAIYWKRRVVERCIYGVDRNPLAVELAKLSLWLATVAADKPLSFLDHHLQCGDSLIGADVADLGWAPPVVLGKKAQKQLEQQKAGQMNLFEYRLSQQLPAVMGKVLEIVGQESDNYAAVQAKDAAGEAIGQLKAPFEAVADLWVSAYFGHEVTPADYGEALDAIGSARLGEIPAVQKAQEMARERRFFHWYLAFPEVFYDQNGQPLGDSVGFDAVIGNPPYSNAWDMTDLDIELRDAVKQLSLDTDLLSGHWDLYIAFMVKAFRLLCCGGFHSFIVPDALAREKYAFAVRQYVLSNMILTKLLHFEGVNVFDEVSRHCVIYIIENNPPLESSQTIVEKPTTETVETLSKGVIAQSDWLSGEGSQLRVHLANLPIRQLLANIVSGSIMIGQFCYVMVGATTHAKDGSFLKEDVVSFYPIGNAKRFIDGKNLSRYELRWDGRYIDYRPNEMYGPRVRELFENHKVLVRDVTGKNEQLLVSFDDAGLYCDHLVTCITYYENVQHANVQTDFKGYGRVEPPYPKLEYVTALLASRLLTWYFREIFATGTLQGSYSHTYPQQVRAFPIYQIEFTTSEKNRIASREDAENLYYLLCQQGDFTKILAVVDNYISNCKYDIVHDLLAFLAQEMIDSNKEKAKVSEDFWLDLEGVSAPGTFDDLRSKGKWESTLWKAEVCRLFVDEESRSTRHLDDSLGWNEDAFKAFVKALAGPVSNLSDLVHVHRKHHPHYSDLLDRIGRTDVLIDQIVYKLYGLTEEEISIVEGES